MGTVIRKRLLPILFEVPKRLYCTGFKLFLGERQLPHPVRSQCREEVRRISRSTFGRIPAGEGMFSRRLLARSPSPCRSRRAATRYTRVWPAEQPSERKRGECRCCPLLSAAIKNSNNRVGRKKHQYRRALKLDTAPVNGVFYPARIAARYKFLRTGG